MPKLTIDGIEVEVPAGTRIIEAAKKAGLDVPYYCYHPGLSVAGNCRMCLVEIEKMPKLQIACHMTAADGMVVKTQTEQVLKTRKHVLEFLLVNHPVDCPVCDQAGECWLQDYYMKHGLYTSRLQEDKVKKPKAVPLGPTVMLDAERCILCSRCIRFCDEVSKTSELGFINRGNHTEIAVAPGKELDNPYSGNTVDICPVGALTDRDFRFKIRVWYLKEADSVCNGCSRGCSIQAHYNLDRPHHAKGERIMRLKPRFNEKVNKWWMCDEGRYGYKYHDHNRIAQPVKRTEKKVSEVSWDSMLQEVARKILSSGQKTGIILSPQLSNEELYLARRLFCEELKLDKVFLLAPNPDGFQDDILIRADKNPNSKGAEFLGFGYNTEALEKFLDQCAQGGVEGLVVFGQNLSERLDGPKVQKALSKLAWTAFIGSNHNLMSESACYILPAATHFEKEGTFTNFEGIVQKFNKVLEPLDGARAEWEILASLAKALGIAMKAGSPEEIFLEMAGRLDPFRNQTYESSESEGSDIRSMAAPTIPSLQQYDNIL